MIFACCCELLGDLTNSGVAGKFTRFAMKCDFTNCMPSIISNIMCFQGKLYDTEKITGIEINKLFHELTIWETITIKIPRMV